MILIQMDNVNEHRSLGLCVSYSDSQGNYRSFCSTHAEVDHLTFSFLRCRSLLLAERDIPTADELIVSSICKRFRCHTNPKGFVARLGRSNVLNL